MIYQNQNKGTGRVKWGGGWEGSVEEGLWGGIINPKNHMKNHYCKVFL